MSKRMGLFLLGVVLVVLGAAGAFGVRIANLNLWLALVPGVLFLAGFAIQMFAFGMAEQQMDQMEADWEKTIE